jgi:hypothetical protein
VGAAADAANGKAEGTTAGAAEGKAGRGVRAQRRLGPGAKGAHDRRRHRRRCTSREVAVREMGGAQKRVAAARRPDRAGRGEWPVHGSRRRRRGGLTRPVHRSGWWWHGGPTQLACGSRRQLRGSPSQMAEEKLSFGLPVLLAFSCDVPAA